MSIATLLRGSREAPRIEAASPYLDAEGMVRGDKRRRSRVSASTVSIRNVIGAVTDLGSDLLVGSLEALEVT